jgi:hypothetical protein
MNVERTSSRASAIEEGGITDGAEAILDGTG